MSVLMKLHFVQFEMEDGNIFVCNQQIQVEGDYRFYGHIIDMSERLENDSTIPAKPQILSVPMTLDQRVETCDSRYRNPKWYIPTGKDFFLCKAGEFIKIRNVGWTKGIFALLQYLKALDSESQIIIQMSW